MHWAYEKLRDSRPLLVVMYLAIMGFLCVSSVRFYLRQPFDLMPGILSIGFIFGIYTLNRYTDMREDFTNDIGKFMFFSRHQYLLYVASALLAACSGYLMAQGRFHAYHAGLIGLGVLYSYRLIPLYKRGTGFVFSRIKDILFAKNLVVALLWGGSVFIFPLLYQTPSHLDMTMVSFLAGGLFLSTMNNTLFDDVRDEPGDRLAGVTTLPTVIGACSSIRLLVGMDLAWIGLLGASFWLGLLPALSTAVLIALAAYPLAYLLPYARGFKGKLLAMLAELDLAVFAVSLVALTML